MRIVRFISKTLYADPQGWTSAPLKILGAFFGGSAQRARCFGGVHMRSLPVCKFIINVILFSEDVTILHGTPFT